MSHQDVAFAVAARPSSRCEGTTVTGDPCKNPPLRNRHYCRHHRQQVISEVPCSENSTGSVVALENVAKDSLETGHETECNKKPVRRRAGRWAAGIVAPVGFIAALITIAQAPTWVSNLGGRVPPGSSPRIENVEGPDQHGHQHLSADTDELVDADRLLSRLRKCVAKYLGHAEDQGKVVVNPSEMIDMWVQYLAREQPGNAHAASAVKEILASGDWSKAAAEMKSVDITRGDKLQYMAFLGAGIVSQQERDIETADTLFGNARQMFPDAIEPSLYQIVAKLQNQNESDLDVIDDLFEKIQSGTGATDRDSYALSRVGASIAIAHGQRELAVIRLGDAIDIIDRMSGDSGEYLLDRLRARGEFVNNAISLGNLDWPGLIDAVQALEGLSAQLPEVDNGRAYAFNTLARYYLYKAASAETSEDVQYNLEIAEGFANDACNASPRNNIKSTFEAFNTRASVRSKLTESKPQERLALLQLAVDDRRVALKQCVEGKMQEAEARLRIKLAWDLTLSAKAYATNGIESLAISQKEEAREVLEKGLGLDVRDEIKQKIREAIQYIDALVLDVK